MTINIHGSIKVGPSWSKLDKMLRSMLGDGRLVKIARRDGQCNYRDTFGTYDLLFVPESGDATEIELRVNTAA